MNDIIERGETLILRGFLRKLGNANPDSYEWLSGEAWYLGHPIQGRATEIELLAIYATMDAIAKREKIIDTQTTF